MEIFERPAYCKINHGVDGVNQREEISGVEGCGGEYKSDRCAWLDRLSDKVCVLMSLIMTSGVSMLQLHGNYITTLMPYSCVCI